MNNNDGIEAAEVWLHRQALFTAHHLAHLVRDIQQPLSHRYRAVWGDCRLRELHSALEALQRFVEIDDLEVRPEERVPSDWLNQWRQGFALNTGASFLWRHLFALLRGLRNPRGINVRRRLGAEYLLNLGMATKALKDLYEATREWPGPDTPISGKHHTD
jgi:hypothetical protein